MTRIFGRVLWRGCESVSWSRFDSTRLGKAALTAQRSGNLDTLHIPNFKPANSTPPTIIKRGFKTDLLLLNHVPSTFAQLLTLLSPTSAVMVGHSVAVDSPLADLSANVRDMRINTSPSKGASLKSGQRLGALGRKDSGIAAVSDLKTAVNKDWQGPDKILKSKVTPSISRGDRYIPNRELKRSGTHQLVDDDGNDTIRSVISSDATDPNIAVNIAAANAIPTDLEGAPTLEEVAQAESGQRILSFSAAPPSSSANPDVRSRYAIARPKNTLPSSLNSAGRRKIPTNPERTLDAPNMVDDYYYNLLDWSASNVIAIALQTGVWLWNANTGDASQLLDTTTHSERVGGNGLVTGLRWDADGNILSVGLEGGYTQLWDVESSTRLRTLKPTAEGGADLAAVNVMAWAPDGTLNAGFQSGIIKEFDVRERDALTRTLEKAHSGPVCGIEWRSDSALMASGGNDNVVKVWDRRTAVPKMRKENHTAAVKVSSGESKGVRPALFVFTDWAAPIITGTGMVPAQCEHARDRWRHK